MKNIKMLALATATVAAISGNAFAADRGSDIHAGNYKWMQFNAMYSIGEKPNNITTGDRHDYLEMEFGGRAGVVDLYGYVDIFNLANRDSSGTDKGPGTSKLFMKFAPRFSIDAITGKDLSIGPIKEVYFSTLYNWNGSNLDSNSVNNSFWGVGADVEVPWLGKTGMNLYGLYDLNAKDWDGYQFSMNWFKPFYFLDNGSFFAYQGYIDYQFDVAKVQVFPGQAGKIKSSNGGAMFNGIYWHSDRFALGYGLKTYKEVYALADDGIVGETSGFSHYLAATYKF
ncbi:outer membrane protein OmpK [Shewanella sp. SR44-3]|uniref:nucleoside-specific channel-forming Tsx family protein n=1 Tax=Shewanella sp. SR44-3 TaxID=2760936 RepID=UPI0015FBECF2|nr:outer membrane protein OmpK [Shewanella sp. SR44-3]MBB1270176.1 outer membrane protein OmpK [Shewanella sp. SR44-3]